MMSDVIPDPRNFTNTLLLQIIMRRARVRQLRFGLFVYKCARRGRSRIKRVAG